MSKSKIGENINKSELLKVKRKNSEKSEKSDAISQASSKN